MRRGESRCARFEELYRRHAAAVAAYALRRAPREAAEDAVADAFLVAWRRLDQVPVPALPWLLAVARRTLANDRRSGRRRERLAERLRLELDGVAVEPLEPRLADALGSLSEGEREVLLLIAWEGLSTAEAADVLGCSAVACRIRLHRARRRLASALASETSQAAAIRFQEAS